MRAQHEDANYAVITRRSSSCRRRPRRRYTGVPETRAGNGRRRGRIIILYHLVNFDGVLIARDSAFLLLHRVQRPRAHDGTRHNEKESQAVIDFPGVVDVRGRLPPAVRVQRHKGTSWSALDAIFSTYYNTFAIHSYGILVSSVTDEYLFENICRDFCINMNQCGLQ